MSRKARIEKIARLCHWEDPEVERRRDEQAIEARRRAIQEAREELGEPPNREMEAMMEQVAEMSARVRRMTGNFGKDVKRFF